MNPYLDKATNAAIEAKMLRFDDREIIGKTVAHSIYDSNVAAMSFTDGTWCAVEGYLGYDDSPEVYHVVYGMDLYNLNALGLITDEQLEIASKKECDEKRKRKLEQLRRLQAEIGEGDD